MTALGAEATSARLREAAPGGLRIADGLVVEPAHLLPAWLGDVGRATIARAEAAAGGGWRLLDPAGEVVGEADVVCLAAGVGSAALAPALELAPVRGQASLADGVAVTAAAFGGYVIPTRAGALFGATHDRGDGEVDVRAADHGRNLATLAATLPELAARLAATSLSGRAGVRATTPDHLPLAGAAPDAASGLFVLSGLGSRGYALAPLLAEHVAALAAGAPSPLSAAQAALVAPARFRERARRRGRLGDDRSDV
jgi:tRNA 5-methylaminomethyl-2-thiouridine biosynthesis bifunctional protein